MLTIGRLESVGQLQTAASKILSPKKMHVISVLGKDGEGRMQHELFINLKIYMEMDRKGKKLYKGSNCREVPDSTCN